MLTTLPDVTLTDEYVEFHAYPFAPASVAEIGVLPWSVVAEVLPDAEPPEIRTRGGEILFVRAEQREALRAAASEAGVPCVQRVDVWALVLEPFRDTLFDQQHQERTLLALAASGVSRQECLALRQEAALALAGAGFGGRWDSPHLGLYDLLLAYRAAGAAVFAASYRAALAVARRAAAT